MASEYANGRDALVSLVAAVPGTVNVYGEFIPDDGPEVQGGAGANGLFFQTIEPDPIGAPGVTVRRLQTWMWQADGVSIEREVTRRRRINHWTLYTYMSFDRATNSTQTHMELIEAVMNNLELHARAGKGGSAAGLFALARAPQWQRSSGTPLVLFCDHLCTFAQIDIELVSNVGVTHAG